MFKEEKNERTRREKMEEESEKRESPEGVSARGVLPPSNGGELRFQTQGSLEPWRRPPVHCLRGLASPPACLSVGQPVWSALARGRLQPPLRMGRHCTLGWVRADTLWWSESAHPLSTVLG